MQKFMLTCKKDEKRDIRLTNAAFNAFVSARNCPSLVGQMAMNVGEPHLTSQKFALRLAKVLEKRWDKTSRGLDKVEFHHSPLVKICNAETPNPTLTTLSASFSFEVRRETKNQSTLDWSGGESATFRPMRAGDGIRTRDLFLGKETYYRCTTPAIRETII